MYLGICLGEALHGPDSHVLEVEQGCSGWTTLLNYACKMHNNQSLLAINEPLMEFSSMPQASDVHDPCNDSLIARLKYLNVMLFDFHIYN